MPEVFFCSIQVLPVRCPVTVVLGILSAHSIASLISQCQLAVYFFLSTVPCRIFTRSLSV